ncbi:MFS general substrate transporter [Aspergillus steynii IBT 23096]|uniref:MFS general substrate transporter n=1 Tax=Aspergillus steynii IBT 23096 TaxID=1392250 RepID=A0A2I2GK97_9EURO|nr:MFS general substrate transporter [Aspergillus steynii IBT 23096]PLB53300.1 MFS general substrate transporter [Aspergillus steynii IBT 23096]
MSLIETRLDSREEQTQVLSQQSFNPDIDAVVWANFVLVGVSDEVYSALILYNADITELQEDYKLSITVVSLIFITPFAGYAIATIIVNKTLMTFGQRGIAIIGPLCHILPFIVMAIHPPFPVMLVAYIIVGLGNGLVDAAWNSWTADMINANALMGFLGAFYGLGATLSLTIHADATCFRRENRKSADASGGGRTMEAMKSPITWIMAVWLFVYMGVEVSVGGWIVDLMVQVRGGGYYESGFIPTGFWAGVTLGRLVLGFVNDWLGERTSITIYLVLSIALELILWSVPNFTVSAIAVTFLGFFTGPLFPAALVIAAKLLPKHLHAPGIGLVSSLAGGGGAILPFVAGTISGARGMQSLQGFVLALLATLIIIWMLLPREKHSSYSD